MIDDKEEVMDDENNEAPKGAGQAIASPNLANTGKVELEMVGNVIGFTHEIVDATTHLRGKPGKKELLPGIEKINGELGRLIGSLTYQEYRELAGMLMALREEEQHHDEMENQGRRKKNKFKHEANLMKRLISFINDSQLAGVKKLAPFLQQRGQFLSDDIMTQLILMTRLYYMKGVNMLNPEADPEKEDSIKLREDKNISIRIDRIGIPMLSIGKNGDKISATYPHGNGSWTQMNLEDGKLYIFGRGHKDFRVDNCPDSFHELWGSDQCEVINGIEIGTVSRSSIGVEVRGEKIAFYDRASRHNLTFSWEKFSPEGHIIDRREGIAEYFSRPRSERGSRVSLGSSVREDGKD